MAGTWLTYRELADRWSWVEAVRRRALRGRWQKQLGNDGKVRILVPDGVEIEPRTVRVPDAQGDGHPGEKGADPAHFPAAATIAALEGHVATLKAELDHRAAEIDTLKAQLAGAEGRAGEEAAKTGQAIAAVEAHNATLKADVEKLEGLLGGERERADAEATKCAETIRASAAQFTHERERADRAIAAFESLAQRLEAMAETRRPWWRRLVG